MADDLGWRGALRGLVLLALMWWAWCSYAWLGNQARADEGVVRVAMIGAMAALFLVALAIPEAWGDEGGGISAPILLAVCLGLVRSGHLGVYVIAAGGDAALRRTVLRTAVPVAVAAVLLVVGAVLGGPAQTALWALALLVDYTGIYLLGGGWRLPAPGHFAERDGLIVIIALGGSLIAGGGRATHPPVTVPIVAAALLGLTVSLAMWWLYFDVVAPVAERVLRGKQGQERVRLARDSYTYLHFPMVAGIIYLALGLKKVAQHVSGTGHHALSDPMTGTPLWALFGGGRLPARPPGLPGAQPRIGQRAAGGHGRGTAAGAARRAAAARARPAGGAGRDPRRADLLRGRPLRLGPRRGPRRGGARLAASAAAGAPGCSSPGGSPPHSGEGGPRA